MSLYWVYDLPSWLFGVLTIAIAVAIGLAGLYATRKWVRRVHGSQHSHNDVVGYYLAAVCVFYGITFGVTRSGDLAKLYRCSNPGGPRSRESRCPLPGCERFCRTVQNAASGGYSRIHSASGRRGLAVTKLSQILSTDCTDFVVWLDRGR
jgi:hypothetical protein